ncbi:MAG: hypothetical protein DI538_20805 [Azospira oryzae]|jgi:hypothetical protein|nr:hypothetical protein [Cytophaga sp.]PZR31573.1 MAG: hypothetical protein DI538_20805 [Azospira oryzae]
MTKRALKAYAAFLCTGLLIYLSAWGIVQAGWITQLPSFTIPILVFFFGITSLIYKYITRFSTYGAATEIQFYLGSIVLKLLMGCGFLWAMSMVDRPNVNANAVLFLVSYILYTAVEIAQLMVVKKA